MYVVFRGICRTSPGGTFTAALLIATGQASIFIKLTMAAARIPPGHNIQNQLAIRPMWITTELTTNNMTTPS
jgi:hypothetical protein